MYRRTVLAGGGATFVTGFAGCLGGDDSGNDGNQSDSAGERTGESGVVINTGTPTAVVKSWHRLKFKAALAERKERAVHVFHNESPRIDTIESQQIENVANNTIDNISAAVIKENLTQDELYSGAGRLVTNETLAEVTDGETARVRATLEVTTEEGLSGEREVVHTVVTENGEWQILVSVIPND